MRRYFRMELKRAFLNKRMILVLLILVGLSVCHYMEHIYPNREYIMGMGDGYGYLSSFNGWIGGEWGSLEATWLYLLIPLFCALPYGASWAYDCKSGIGAQAMIRGEKAAFLWTKIAVSFLSGAAIVMFALWFDFLLTSSTYPAITPKVGMGLSFVHARNILSGLFYEHPFAYISIYIGINGLYFGLLNTLSLVSRFFTKNNYIAILTPFLYYMVFHCAGTTSGHMEWAASGFLSPAQRYETTWFILIFQILLMLVISGLSTRRFIREEEGLL